MKYYVYPRNVLDLLADGKTSYTRRIGASGKGLVIPLDSIIEYLPYFYEHLFTYTETDDLSNTKCRNYWKRIRVPRLSSIKIYSMDSWKNWHQITSSYSARTQDPTYKFDKKRVHRNGLSKSESQEHNHVKKSCNKNDTHAEKYDTWRKISTSSKSVTSSRSTHFQKHGQCQHVVTFSKDTCLHIKIRQRRDPSRCIILKFTSHERSFYVLKFT